MESLVLKVCKIVQNMQKHLVTLKMGSYKVVLMLTHTRSTTYVSGIAHFTKASEGSHRVDALTMLTQAWHDLTLINICGITQNILK